MVFKSTIIDLYLGGLCIDTSPLNLIELSIFQYKFLKLTMYEITVGMGRGT